LDEEAIALRVAKIASKREGLLDFVKTKQVQRALELYERLDSSIKDVGNLLILIYLEFLLLTKFL